MLPLLTTMLSAAPTFVLSLVQTNLVLVSLSRPKCRFGHLIYIKLSNLSCFNYMGKKQEHFRLFPGKYGLQSTGVLVQMYPQYYFVAHSNMSPPVAITLNDNSPKAHCANQPGVKEISHRAWYPRFIPCQSFFRPPRAWSTETTRPCHTQPKDMTPRFTREL